MQETELNTKTNTETAEVKEVKEHSLKGTLYFVMFVGTTIFISWFAIFFLYLSRI